LDSKYLLAILLVVVVIVAASSVAMAAMSMNVISKLSSYISAAQTYIPSYNHEKYSGLGYILDQKANTIIVTATATTYVMPSRVRIYVTIENVEPFKNAADAYTNVTLRASKLIDRVKAMEGVIYVQTTGLTLSPSYEYRSGQRIFKGYIAAYSLLIESNVESAGKVIAEVVNAEADAIKWIALTAPDNVIENAKKEALREAINNAYEKAKLIANELNISLGKVLHVSIGYTIPTVRTYTQMLEYKVVAEGLPETPIEVGKGLAITTTVTAAFEIS